MGSHSTEPQDQNQTDAHRRGRRALILNAAGDMFLMVMVGSGRGELERLQETGTHWEEQRAK